MDFDNTAPLIKTLDNGLVVIMDEMPNVGSVSYNLLMPGGIANDPEDAVGECLLVADWLSKGVQGLNARELSEEYEIKGISHGESAGLTSIALSGRCIFDHYKRGLELTSKLVLEPTVDSSYKDSLSSVLLQDVESLKDEPARWCMHELNSVFHPSPYNRSRIGTESGIKKTDANAVKLRINSNFKPKGSVLSICGKINSSETFEVIESLFGNWSGDAVGIPEYGNRNDFKPLHLKLDSAQSQIAVAFKAPHFGHKDYYVAKVVHQILSGGMFGRLFAEVREKKGLCYSVSASHVASKLYGSTLIYSGTTPERAEETLTTIMQELGRLKGTVEDEELSRAKANMKSSVLLLQDSSASRAGSNAGDWWNGGLVRTAKEINDAIEKVTKEDVESYFDIFKPKPNQLVVIGPEPLNI